ncbi:hypothetical protein THRCLA_05934 [Thraustotheca clavata]|uniref:Kinesin motor domain-containing protein n=1 Tax=Thraustotheca clavata TaxID=74557 RepID=A0A1V9ZR62_9STRA|nr:hypothetical protein THRCLA_05934 [Thraustotheca clavata]
MENTLMGCMEKKIVMELANADNAVRSLLRRDQLPSSVVEAANGLLQKPEASVYCAAIPSFLYEAEKPRWEVLAVGFVLAQEFAEQVYQDKQVLGIVLKMCHNHLENLEPRVRRLVGKVLGALASKMGVELYNEFHADLMEIVECNITRSPEFEEVNEEEYFAYFDTSIPLASPLSTPKSPHRLDDISGFKALETCLLTLKYIVHGLGSAFLQVLPENHFSFLTSIVQRSVRHGNRHVRNVGFETIYSLCKFVLPSGYLTSNGFVGETITDCLVRGLQDPWSEVRLTASQATRAFVNLCTLEERTTYYPKLIPRMCLNRHYVAEGVKQYSRDTWSKLLGSEGRSTVAKYVAECVACYIDATDADNPFVREAACICIGELVFCVDPSAVRPFVPELLLACRVTLQDDVFTVSDAACSASAHVVLHFPKESQSCLDKLIKWWTIHLSDDVWSVRENAAIALGTCARAYFSEPEILDKIVHIAQTFLLKAKDQPAMTQAAYDALIKAETAHMNKQRFSCCSFEPRQMKKQLHDCDDHDAGHALWAHTDGAIYLVRELCDVPATQAKAIALFPQLADVAILRHFPQTAVLQETLWKQLPAIGQSLGKQVFKRHIEIFFDPLAMTLRGTHRLAKFAAVECVKQLSTLIGPTIFRGRLEANDLWMEHIAPLVNAPTSSIHVSCRIRPQNALERKQGGLECVVSTDGKSLEINPEDGFSTDYLRCTFDQVFSQQATQEDVYNATAKTLVKELLSGYNCTVFAYGQTGSGKTHTVLGPKDGIDSKPEERGLIARLVHDIFSEIEQTESTEFEVMGSFIEIYMEKIRDLLAANFMSKSNLRIREHGPKGIYVDDLTQVPTLSEDAMMQLVERGNTNRVVACTRMNNDSSRSHTILMINVTRRDVTKGTEKKATMYVVDLAGSEMVSKTLASGKTLNEAKAINKSLSALSNVIKALVQGQKHIPFISFSNILHAKDSKLTRLLQDSLGGHAKTCLIVTVSSSSYNVSETISTVRFGTRAKEIKNEPIQNEVQSMSSTQYQQMYQDLLKQHNQLQAEYQTIQAEKELLQAKCESFDLFDSPQDTALNMNPEIPEENAMMSTDTQTNAMLMAESTSQTYANLTTDTSSQTNLNSQTPSLMQALSSFLFVDNQVPTSHHRSQSIDLSYSQLANYQEKIAQLADDLRLCRSENDALKEINSILSQQNTAFNARTEELESAMSLHDNAMEAVKQLNVNISAKNSTLEARNAELEEKLEKQVSSMASQVVYLVIACLLAMPSDGPSMDETSLGDGPNTQKHIETLSRKLVEMKLHAHYVSEYSKAVLDHEKYQVVCQMTQLKLQNEQFRYNEHQKECQIKELEAKIASLRETIEKRIVFSSVKRSVQEYQSLYKEQVRLSHEKQQHLIKEVEYYKMIWHRVTKTEPSNNSLTLELEPEAEKPTLNRPASFTGAVPTEPLSLMALKRSSRTIGSPSTRKLLSPKTPQAIDSKEDENDPLSTVFKHN